MISARGARWRFHSLVLPVCLLALNSAWLRAEQPATPPGQTSPVATTADAASNSSVPPALSAALAKKNPSSVADLKAIEQQVRKVVGQVVPATVGVRIGASMGSGVIISEDGYVLTAGHVSGKAGQEAVFILHDGREVKGKTLGI